MTAGNHASMEPGILQNPHLAALCPLDEHNRLLQSHVHPGHWRNPVPSGRYNLVVIGAGPAGLVAASAAAGLSAKVALIERGLMGGDCLNVGCVPSKAIIRCARAAADARDAQRFGVRAAGVEIDFQAVMERMRGLRAELSRHDSADRFAAMGVDVFLGEARFTGRDAIEVAGQTLRFARALVATGARAAIPPIEGLEQAGYLTNETLFSLTELPRRLAVIGGGPIGCEMAQAFARLGARVTLVESGGRILPRDDADAAERVAAALQRDGVELVCGGKTLNVSTSGSEHVLRLVCDGDARELRADQVLVAAGRAPNVESLNLAAAGIAYDLAGGIEVNHYLQTTNRRVYAAGDVASRFQFTHAADAMARIVIRNALFFGRERASALTIPRVTYTDPELAHVGLGEEDARRQGIETMPVTVPLGEVDRAVLDGETDGFLRLCVEKGRDRILGATLVARHAGDMISEITALMAAGGRISTLANTIHPYPARAEIFKKAADAHNRARLTPRVKRVFKALLRWRR